MKKNKDEINNFKFKSKKSLLREAKSDIKKYLNESNIEDTILTAGDTVIKEKQFYEIAKEEEKKLEKEIEQVQKLSDSEKVDWIIKKHKEFTDIINGSIQGDFLNGTDYTDRCLILVYMYQLLDLLTTYGIEFNKKMIQLLEIKNCDELLSILNCFNYLSLEE
jgi:hypothetical protein